MVILRTWIRKEVVFYLQRGTTRRMGQESLNWWWSNSEKADTQFSQPRVDCVEERSKAKEVDNYRYISVPMGIRLKLFFAQYFLVISSVFTEQSQMYVRNTVLVKQERRDPCWQDNLTHGSSQQDYWWQHLHVRLRFQHKKILLQKYEERVERFPQQDRLMKICIDAGFRKNSWSRTVFHDKGHWRVLTIYRTSDMLWVHFATGWKINWPERLDSREHQNWTRVGSHKQIFAR